MGFRKNGCLAEGIHEMSWDEVSKTFDFSLKRKELLAKLREVVVLLKAYGCTCLYLDGSIITDKLSPGDWDACYDAPIGLLNELRKQDPILFSNNAENKKKRKEKYGGDLFFAGLSVNPERMSFIEFFQQIRDSDEKKGIVKINLQCHDD
jgi:hypothetical protein